MPFFISEAEYAEIELAVLVLTPLGWATDIVQSDKFTVEQCLQLHSTILGDYDHLFSTLKSRREVVTFAKKALNNRAGFFRNRLVSAHQTLRAYGAVDSQRTDRGECTLPNRLSLRGTQAFAGLLGASMQLERRELW